MKFGVLLISVKFKFLEKNIKKDPINRYKTAAIKLYFWVFSCNSQKCYPQDYTFFISLNVDHVHISEKVNSLCIEIGLQIAEIWMFKAVKT